MKTFKTIEALKQQFHDEIEETTNALFPQEDLMSLDRQYNGYQKACVEYHKQQQLSVEEALQVQALLSIIFSIKKNIILYKKQILHISDRVPVWIGHTNNVLELFSQDNYEFAVRVLLKDLCHNDFKRMGEDIVKPVVLDGINMHTYKKVKFYPGNNVGSNIPDYIRKKASWATRVGVAINRAGKERLIKELKVVDSPAFHDVYPNRYLFAFLNGVYNAKDCTFTEWKEFKGNEVCINHFKTEFQGIEMKNQNFWTGDWFTKIKTPSLNKILGLQIRDQKVLRCVLALCIGRLLRWTDDCQNEQFVPCFVGESATGKSTLGRVLQAIYPPSYVKALSNNIEDSFGLSMLLGSLLIICPEIDNDFRLKKTDFLSIIDCVTPMSLAVKQKQAVCIEKWLIPLLLIGNVLPIGPGKALQDHEGELIRRVMCVLFDTVPCCEDPMLHIKLLQELPNIILKCSIGYCLWLDGKPEQLNVREYLEKNKVTYFKDTAAKLLSRGDVFSMFLQNFNNPDYEIIYQGPNKRIKGYRSQDGKMSDRQKWEQRQLNVYMPENLLKGHFYRYLDEIKYDKKPPTWNVKLYGFAFKCNKIKKLKRVENKIYPRDKYATCKGPWISGIDIVRKDRDKKGPQMQEEKTAQKSLQVYEEIDIPVDDFSDIEEMQEEKMIQPKTMIMVSNND